MLRGAAPAATGEQETVAGFVHRRYSCYRCGARGRETRGLALRHGSTVFVLRDATVLLACCPRCRIAPPAPTAVPEAAELSGALQRDVRYGLVPGAVRAVQLACPVAGCPTPQWARTTGPLPFGLVYDPDLDQLRHPCPWCTADAPATSARAQHDAAGQAARDFTRWESELV